MERHIKVAISEQLMSRLVANHAISLEDFYCLDISAKKTMHNIYLKSLTKAPIRQIQKSSKT